MLPRHPILLWGFPLAIICILMACSPEGGGKAEEEEAGKADSLAVFENLSPQIASLSRRIKEEPQNDELYFTRANAYQLYGNLKLAASDYQKAYMLDSSKAGYAIALADILFQTGQSQRSIELLKAYNERQMGEVDVLKKLANYHLIIRQYRKSLDYLNAILKEDVQNSEAYFLKGIAFKELGDSSRAISNFQTAAEIRPEYYEAYMQLAILFHEQQKELALRYYDNALALNDTSREALYGKAKFLQDVEQYADAIALYRELITIDPQNSDGMYNIASIYYGLDSLEKAYRFFDLTTRIDPVRATAYYGKGLCKESMGNTEEAITYYEQALNLNAEFQEAEEKLTALRTSNGS